MSRMNWPNTNAEMDLRDTLNGASSESFDLAQILSRAFEELPIPQRRQLARLAKKSGYHFERDGMLVRNKPYRPVHGTEY